MVELQVSPGMSVSSVLRLGGIGKNRSSSVTWIAARVPAAFLWTCVAWGVEREREDFATVLRNVVPHWTVMD